LTLEKLEVEIEQIKSLNLIDTGDTLTMGIGVITPQRIKSFHDLAVESGLFEEGDIDLDKVADFRFVGKGVGLDLRKTLGSE